MNNHSKKIINIYGEMDMQFQKFTRLACHTFGLALVMLTGLNAQAGLEPYDVERVGLSGWQFLKINADARHSAMGGALTALSSGDAGAVFGNPSALADVTNTSVSLGQVNWFADINYQTLSLAKNLGNMGVIALSLASLDIGDIPVTINRGITGSTATEAFITGETFTGGDFAAGISYARQVTNRLSIGGNLRYIKETVADLSMNNISLDVGTTYYTGWRSLRLAMIARNLGGDTQLAGWDETIQAEPVDIRMPLDFRVGVAMDFFEGKDSPHKLTVSVEGVHPNDASEKLNMGMEYWYGKMLALRCGYRGGYDDEALTLGGGVNIEFGGVGTAVDYAYVPFGRLGTVHMFTINLGIK
jgi:hypothetical protein